MTRTTIRTSHIHRGRTRADASGAPVQPGYTGHGTILGNHIRRHRRLVDKAAINQRDAGKIARGPGNLRLYLGNLAIVRIGDARKGITSDDLRLDGAVLDRAPVVGGKTRSLRHRIVSRFHMDVLDYTIVRSDKANRLGFRVSQILEREIFDKARRCQRVDKPGRLIFLVAYGEVIYAEPVTVEFSGELRRILYAVIAIMAPKVFLLSDRLESLLRIPHENLVCRRRGIDIVRQLIHRRKLVLAEPDGFQVAVCLDQERVILGAGTLHVHHRHVDIAVGANSLVHRLRQVAVRAHPGKVRIRGIGGNPPGLLEIPALVVLLLDHLIRIPEFTGRRRLGLVPNGSVVIHRRVGRTHVFADDAAKLGSPQNVAYGIGILHGRIAGISRQPADAQRTDYGACPEAILDRSLAQAAEQAADIFLAHNGILRCAPHDGTGNLFTGNATHVVRTADIVLHEDVLDHGALVDTCESADVVLAANLTLGLVGIVGIAFSKI